ncbi:MAG TPA: DUF2059 domain-containing protein [Pyrinomonadaceae bacterium]|nr:DUF2059 domain-containing protein [Pyrinomonadaceae bacterium]
MQKLKPMFLAIVCIALCGTLSSARAQSSDKRDLIAEFRKLTGANNVTGSINFSPDGIREILSSIVAEDKELNDAQRQSLRKSVDEATARVDKTVRGFLNDQTEIAKLSEEVIYRIYDTSFTEAELKEVLAFYRTPSGQKAAVFLPSLSSRVQTEFGPVIQQKLQVLIQPMLQTEIEQLKQKIKDAKIKTDSN